MIEKLLKALNIKQEDISKRYIYLAILLLFGVLLMIFSNAFSKKLESEELGLQSPVRNQEETEIYVSKNKENPGQENTIDQLESKLEEQLKAVLEKTEALADVEVMINLDSTNINVYEKNFIKGKQITDETDQNGGKRKVEDDTEETQIVLIRKGDQESPLLLQTQKPSVRGVLVIARGLESKNTQMMVIDAISKFLDVPSHRVSIMNRE